jgi:proteasome lid subunit RPN8/RPN11
METQETQTRDGWTPAAVGCYWYRGPYTIATIAQGNRSGYALSYYTGRERGAAELATFVSWDEAVRLADAHAAGPQVLAALESNRKKKEPVPARTAKIVFSDPIGGNLPRLTSPKGVAEYVIQYLQEQTDVLQDGREHSYVLPLSTKCQLLTAPYLLSIGTDDAAPMDASEIYRFAILAGAAQIILVHTHPSGDPTPSPDDLRSTELLLAAGLIVRVQLQDHIIIGGCHGKAGIPRWHSMQMVGQIREKR